jgi:PKD repeat protein
MFTINNSRIDAVDILDKDNILIFTKNKIKIFNLKKLSFLDKIFIAIGESLNDEIVNFYLSKDKTLLAVAYKNRNVKLFDTSKAFNLNNIKSSKKVVIKSSDVNTKNNDKDKKITNKKPRLFIYASQTKGTAPLKVYFKFLSDDEDGKVISYYVNFLGKEFLGRGDLNKSFVYTFRKAGEYKIMVAVKDDKGAITEKQITINVKEKPEETFEDYKREILGN